MNSKLKNLEKPAGYLLWWLDPRSQQKFPAGMAFYYSHTNDYVLRIDEDPLDKNYTLRTQGQIGDKIYYDLWQIIQNRQGKSLRKAVVGCGIFDPGLDRYIHLDYGSKYKTLLLDTSERKQTCKTT